MNGRHDCFRRGNCAIVSDWRKIYSNFISKRISLERVERFPKNWNWSNFAERERERKKVKSSVSGWHIGSKFHCETNRLPPQEFALCDVLAHDRATTSPRLWQKYMEIECFDGGTNYRLEKIFHQLRK